MTVLIEELLIENGLIFAFLFVGLLLLASFWISRTLLRGFIPGVAIAILAGLGLAFLGGKKGIADLPLFSGMALLGGSMLRDFSVVATAMGADHGRHPAHRPLHRPRQPPLGPRLRRPPRHDQRRRGRPRGYGSEAGALRGADGYVLYRAGVPASPFGAVFGGVGGGGLSGGQARFTSSCKSGKRARNSSVSRS